MHTLKSLSQEISAQYIGQDRPFSGGSIDTRTLLPGQLFIAIKGPNFDGHDYIQEAVNKGATALMVMHEVDSALPQIIVEDTGLALGQIAKVWAKQFSIPKVAITGSYGKTTTKEMLASILNQRGNTLSTEGNLNNNFGVPLTLLRLKPEHEFAVIEMGTNHRGEIAYLAGLVDYDFAMITTIADVHTAGIGSLNAINEEKMCIFNGLKDTGTALINQDCPYSDGWINATRRQHHITYSLKHDKSDLQIKDCITNVKGATFTLTTPKGETRINLSLLGKSMVQNALAAASIAYAMGCDLMYIQQGLSAVKPVNRRLHPYFLENNITIIDDSYSATFAAVENAMELLSEFPGQKIFVCTDMREMAALSPIYHAKLGECIKASNIDNIFLFGDKDALNPALDASEGRAKYITSKPELIKQIKSLMHENTAILIKGGRARKMEEVVDALIA